MAPRFNLIHKQGCFEWNLRGKSIGSGKSWDHPHFRCLTQKFVPKWAESMIILIDRAFYREARKIIETMPNAIGGDKGGV